MSAARAGSDRRRRLALASAVAAVDLAIDQLTKSWAVSHLADHPIHLVGPIALRLEFNTGIAFSIGTGLTGPIIVVALVLIAAVVWFARRVPTTLGALGVGLVLGGALGNLADRVLRANHGAVIDFIYTKYWPTFNVADASLVCGCILLAWTLIRHGTGSAEPARSGDGSEPPGRVEPPKEETDDVNGSRHPDGTSAGGGR